MDLKSPHSNSTVTKDAQPHASPVVKTPCPYEQGKSVGLSVTKTFSDAIELGQLTATVTKFYSMTMSPVTEIVYNTKSGATKRGVLKVYDRRFGQSLREIPGLEKGTPPTLRPPRQLGAITSVMAKLRPSSRRSRPIKN